MTDKVLTNLIIDGQIMEASCKNDCSMGGFGKRLLATCCSSPGSHILSNSSSKRLFFFWCATASCRYSIQIYGKFHFCRRTTCFKVRTWNSTQRLNSSVAVESAGSCIELGLCNRHALKRSANYLLTGIM